jgi:DNA glycosylase AlkZ-like
MRGTLHLVSSRDFPLYDAALRRDPAPWTTGRPKPPLELVRATASFAREPRSGAELRAFIVERRGPGTDEENNRDLNWLRHLIPLVPQPESGAWGFVRGVRLRAYDGAHPGPDEALEHLVRRYLAAFGPATRADLAAWSGQVLKTLDTALERMRLRRFLDEEGRELLDLPRAPLAEDDTKAPVRLLSRWDELLIGHAHRRRVIPEEHEPRRLMLSGDPTLLVDGFVAGTWKVERGRAIVEPFDPLPRTVRREVEDESRRLTAFLG